MALMLSTIVVVALSAATAGGATTANGVDVNVKHAGESVERGTLPLEKVTKSGLRTFGMSAAAATAADPPVGTVRLMPVLDDFTGQYRFRGFTLRALGEHIEVWVQEGQPAGFPAGNAGNLNFPAGDCRNDGVRNVITDAQVDYLLIHEFDTNIYPKESAAFSVPPDRDGSDAQLPGCSGAARRLRRRLLRGRRRQDRDARRERSRRRTTTTRTTRTRSSYIAGFFSSQLNGFFDRNVMTIDAFDWVHRTGANPPDEPVPGDNCTSAPARPFLYEGVFAHEYQHLLESYEDPDEVNWINEGLSDWAHALDRLRQPGDADHADRASTATSSASSAGSPSRRRRTRTRGRVRPRELADALERPGRRRDPLRLRRCVLDDGVAPDPVRHRLHDLTPPR